MDLANNSGRYTGVQGAVYGKSCKVFVAGASKMEKQRLATLLSNVAERSSTASGDTRTVSAQGPTERLKVYLLWEDDCCIELEGEAHRSSPLLTRPRPRPPSVSLAPGGVDQPACTTET